MNTLSYTTLHKKTFTILMDEGERAVRPGLRKPWVSEILCANAGAVAGVAENSVEAAIIVLFMA
ncbi:MAG TPA: hypothetical protein VGP06_17115 [Janthinobacterium sp.]|nr:hypothetical protein [Janthinobacterium sp.]